MGQTYFDKSLDTLSASMSTESASDDHGVS